MVSDTTRSDHDRIIDAFIANAQAAMKERAFSDANTALAMASNVMINFNALEDVKKDPPTARKGIAGVDE